MKYATATCCLQTNVNIVTLTVVVQGEVRLSDIQDQ
jgi:hypothetical protein